MAKKVIGLGVFVNVIAGLQHCVEVVALYLVGLNLVPAPSVSADDPLFHEVLFVDVALTDQLVLVYLVLFSLLRLLSSFQPQGHKQLVHLVG